jgi:Zn-dependent peptidase ImmA (M78 family)/transcriptional regulator with XRE-family HTH domain
MFGERIRQARLLAGLTQEALAEALTDAGCAVTKAAVSKYEKNKSRPSAQFLMLAASILAVPNSYFTHQPTVEVTWLAFRRHSDLTLKERAAVKAYAADIAGLHVELHTLLYPEDAVALPDAQPVADMNQAERAAERLRECWELDDHPIDSLVQTAEDRQVVVVGWSHHTGRFDGLSGWCQRHPVTVVSTLVDADRRRFTLAHELGHLIMDTRTVTDKESERLAHRFAAALLVPAERARHELGTRRTSLDWDELGILKRKYGLSMAAWVYRARDLGIITEHHATRLFQQLSERGWRMYEPVEYSADETPLRLEQMAHRAVAEGLMSADQIRRVCPDWFEHDSTTTPDDRFTIYDLLALPEDEQRQMMEAAVAAAANEDMETFEANEFLEENEEPT